MKPTFEQIKMWYDTGRWGEKAVRNAVKKGWITQAECDLILGAGEPEEEPAEE